MIPSDRPFFSPKFFRLDVNLELMEPETQTQKTLFPNFSWTAFLFTSLNRNDRIHETRDLFTASALIPGDVFEKLEDEDEQGWCKGRKDGRVGLYPANYIEVIE